MDHEEPAEGEFCQRRTGHPREETTMGGGGGGGKVNGGSLGSLIKLNLQGASSKARCKGAAVPSRSVGQSVSPDLEQLEQLDMGGKRVNPDTVCTPAKRQKLGPATGGGTGTGWKREQLDTPLLPMYM